MKATIDRSACCGYANCVDVAPDVFRVEADNVAVVLQDPVTVDLEAAVRGAVRDCPMQAIGISG